jgi:hypothetical protein
MKTALSALGAIVLLAGSNGCNSCCSPMSCDRTCTAGGCGPRFRFHPYQSCDACDQCGNWTGAPIVSRSGLYPKIGYAEDYGSISQAGGRGISLADGSEDWRADGGQRWQTDGGQNLRSDGVASAHGYRVVPGSRRVTTRSGRPTLARSYGQPTPAMMADDSVEGEVSSAPARTRAKRVSRGRSSRLQE